MYGSTLLTTLCIIIISPNAIQSSPLFLFPDPFPPFSSGVASGEPLPTAVLIWTRVHVELFVGSNSAMDVEGNVNIQWKVWDAAATSGDYAAQGITQAKVANDYCVTVDVTGLTPSTRYSYVFQTMDGKNSSAIGSTKTAPDPHDTQQPITFVSLSCSSLWGGFFRGYWAIASNPTIDIVFHLGDVIYTELDDTHPCARVPPYLNPNCRGGCSNDTVASDTCVLLAQQDPCTDLGPLEEFRWVHRMYLMDPAYRAARRAHAWISMADNHDLDSSWQTNATRDGSLRAFFEFMPSRLYETLNPGNSSLFRTFTYGKYVDIVTLDTRNIGRDETPPSYLGVAQHAAVGDALSFSASRGASWRIFLSTVAFAPWNISGWQSVVNDIFVAPFVVFFIILVAVVWLQRKHHVRVEETTTTTPPTTKDDDLLLNDDTMAFHRDKDDDAIITTTTTPQLRDQIKARLTTCFRSKCCLMYSIINLVIVIVVWIAIVAYANHYIQSRNIRSGGTWADLYLVAAATRNWDGNPADRDQLLAALNTYNTSNNNMWLTGDMHTVLAANIRDAHNFNTLTTGQSFGVEVMAGSLSRSNPRETISEFGIPNGPLLDTATSFLVQVLTRLSPWLTYVDGAKHGFGIFKVSATNITAEFWFANIDGPAPTWYGDGQGATMDEMAMLGKSMVMRNGMNKWDDD